jgi:cytochrome c biogenesis protein CcdA
VLAYLGGVLTIVSPCILPVLPFVFARADRPFVSNGLPLLAGMAALSDRMTRPLVALGARLSRSAVDQTEHGGPTILPSLLLGVATGLPWAPCAGPILGLILTGAALQGASAQTSFLLIAYAAGAATSLALALLIGGRVFVAMKPSLGAGEWVRRGVGAAVIAAWSSSGWAWTPVF